MANEQSDKNERYQANYGADEARACDWKEDFTQENGNYWNTCSVCERQFVGYKRRTICKLCAVPECGTLSGETPRTDAVFNACQNADRHPVDFGIEIMKHARQLERELADMRQARDTQADLVLAERAIFAASVPLSATGRSELSRQLEGALVNSEGKDFTIQASFVRELIVALSATGKLP